MPIQMQEAQGTSIRQDQNNNTPLHIIVKILDIQKK